MPEMRELDGAGWKSCAAVIEHALSRRPRALQRQLHIFISLLNVMAFARHGRTLSQLIPSMRSEFLHSIENSRVRLIRRGFWGLRTLVFMGFYARPEASAHIGYRAHKQGWQVR